MTTWQPLVVLIYFITAMDLGQPYHFVDSDCLSRYNCTLKPRLPCVVTVLAECPPQARLEHWPSKPTDVRVQEYDSVLRGRRCYGRENVTWRIPSDGSATIVKGFMMTVTCLAGHCVGRKECIYFNMSAAVWKIDDIIEKMQYSFDCLLPLRGKQHFDIATLPEAHDGTNYANVIVTLPLKDCLSPSTTSSTHRPASSTASSTITASGIHDTSTATRKITTTSATSTTTPDVSTTLTWGQATLTQAMSTALAEATRRTGSGVFTVVAVMLGCVCGILLSTLLLFFVYRRYRTTRRSHQKSSSVETDGDHVTYNSARNAAVINGLGDLCTVPDSMPTLETTISGNTERFWDEGPFKPPESVDMDALSTTASELNRAVRIFNEEDAEQQRVNGISFRAAFRPLEGGFLRIDESVETCSIAGTSV